MESKWMAEIYQTITIGKSSTLTVQESLCQTTSLNSQCCHEAKSMNNKRCNCLESGSDGGKIKRDCASLGLCQGDARCDDCPNIR